MRNFKIVAGLEFELEYNPFFLNYMPVHNYHDKYSSEWTDDFYYETDSSIKSLAFTKGEKIEIISKPFELNDIEDIAHNFKKTIHSFTKSARPQPMKELISFNDTTGCHLHFSIMKKKLGKDYIINDRQKHIIKNSIPFNFKNFFDFKTIEKLNETILNNVKKEMPDHYEVFKQHYYRSHAKRIECNDTLEILKIDRSHDNKYYNLNLSLRDDSHVELRSFHLRGITTWEDMFKILNILKDSMYEFFDEEFSKKESFFNQSEMKLPLKGLTRTRNRSLEEPIKFYPLFKDNTINIGLDRKVIPEPSITEEQKKWSSFIVEEFSRRYTRQEPVLIPLPNEEIEDWDDENTDGD